MPAPLPALRHPSLYPLSSIALFYLRRRLRARTQNRIRLFSLKNTERGTSFFVDAPVSLAFKGDPFSFYQSPGRRDDVFYIIFFQLHCVVRITLLRWYLFYAISFDIFFWRKICLLNHQSQGPARAEKAESLSALRNRGWMRPWQSRTKAHEAIRMGNDAERRSKKPKSVQNWDLLYIYPERRENSFSF